MTCYISSILRLYTKDTLSINTNLYAQLYFGRITRRSAYR